mmetsp:Transcript_9426/g.17688  ORF Transcript_9426/g.17688 Transcript_9426/m.17688 type:complete len:264 (-) Transcript_9426:1672-2463(-)
MATTLLVNFRSSVSSGLHSRTSSGVLKSKDTSTLSRGGSVWIWVANPNGVYSGSSRGGACGTEWSNSTMAHGRLHDKVKVRGALNRLVSVSLRWYCACASGLHENRRKYICLRSSGSRYGLSDSASSPTVSLLMGISGAPACGWKAPLSTIVFSAWASSSADGRALVRGGLCAVEGDAPAGARASSCTLERGLSASPCSSSPATSPAASRGPSPPPSWRPSSWASSPATCSFSPAPPGFADSSRDPEPGRLVETVLSAASSSS